MIKIKKKRKLDLFYMGNICTALLVGSIFYLLFRPTTYISLAFYELFNLEWHDIFFLPEVLKEILCNFIPDILWAYALTFSVCFIFSDDNNNFILLAIVCVAFEILIESLQGFGVITGTFDPIDIFLELCSTALALMNIKKHKETQI